MSVDHNRHRVAASNAIGGGIRLCIEPCMAGTDANHEQQHARTRKRKKDICPPHIICDFHISMFVS